jgi:RNA polymerase sigma-70 factor (ECF subfamily)
MCLWAKGTEENPMITQTLNTRTMLPTREKEDIGSIPFEEIYRRYYPRVYSACLRMLANTADAEDLAQDVFLQVQNKINTFRGDSSFTTWLHRVTVNQVLMYFRKRWVRSEQTTDTGEMPDQTDPATDNPQSLPLLDHIAVSSAIKKLPNGYRRVFLLHDVQGYEHEEIARLLGITPGTSKSQLHKARMRLRMLLQEQAELN